MSFWTDPWLLETPIAEWIAFSCGVLGVWLSIREKVAAWPLLLVSTAIYIVYAWLFSVHIQGVNLLVYFALCLYGWWSWAANAQRTKEAQSPINAEEATLIIRRPSKRLLLGAALLWLLLTVVMGWLFGVFDGSSYPYLESFVFCGGLIAQWMVARKLLSCWAAWIVVNIATIALYLTLSMVLTSLLYLTFLGLAVYGWWDWSRKLSNPSA